MALTEFEKTVLLSLFILAKGSTKKSVPIELLLSKYPIRHRKMVRNYLEKFSGDKYVSIRGGKVNINRAALKDVSSYLIKGPRARL